MTIVTPHVTPTHNVTLRFKLQHAIRLVNHSNVSYVFRITQTLRRTSYVSNMLPSSCLPPSKLKRSPSNLHSIRNEMCQNVSKCG